jgi:ANTAR domain
VSAPACATPHPTKTPWGGIAVTSDALIRRNQPLVGHPSRNGFSRYRVAAPPSQEVERSNRRISMAMGILMCGRDIDEDQAFSYLRRVSQESNRKLRDVAEDVIQYRRLPPRTVHADILPF